MVIEPKKPKPTRFTLASIYLAAGLGVGYLILTRMVPALNSLVDEKVKARQAHGGGWHAIVLELSGWVCTHQSICMVGIAIIALGGFVIPFLIRPMRYLVWAAALAVFLFDVALVGGGYGNMISGLLKEANELNR